MREVFVATHRHGRGSVLVARTGREHIDPGSNERFLILNNGVRYDGQSGQGDYRTIEFERYSIRIELPAPVVRHIPYYAMTTSQLYADRSAGARAEWEWRLSKPIVIIVLTLFALVFSHTHPRQGRYLSLFVAIVAYFFYSNMLGVADAMLKRGRLPDAVGLWWVHGLFILLGIYLFWRRATNRPLLPALFGRRLRTAP
jgi:lipopolysaccharide export system permease protein